MDKKALLELLGDDRLEELFTVILRKIETEKRVDLEADYYSLESRYRQWLRHQELGTRTAEAISVEAAQLRESVTNFIGRLYDPPKSKVKKAVTRTWFWPVAIGTICAILIGVGSLKTRSVEFNLTAQARFLAFRLEEDWNLNTDLLIHYFEAFPVASVEIDTFSWAKETYGPLELQLEKGHTHFTELPLDQGTGLNFTLDNHEIIGQLYNASGHFELSLEGTTLLLPDIDFECTFGDSSVVGTLTITTDKAPSFSFIPVNDEGFVLRNVSVSGLDFQQESPGVNQTVISSIDTGTIDIHGIDYNLAERPFVDFIDPRSTTLTLKKSSNLFQVNVLGTARDLRIGVKSSDRRSVKPTYIEALAQNKRANLTWNAVVLIVGVLWGIVKVFKGGKS